jgi:hypothetical protein
MGGLFGKPLTRHVAGFLWAYKPHSKLNSNGASCAAPFDPLNHRFALRAVIPTINPFIVLKCKHDFENGDLDDRDATEQLLLADAKNAVKEIDFQVFSID